MNPSRSLLLATFATAVVMAAPGVAGAAAIASARAPHASLIAAAHPLHTDVHTRVRGHRVHGHHARRHIHAELRAGATAAAAGHGPRAPLPPPHHPARSHALLPHATVKLHRENPRGGSPYALGQASLSVSLVPGRPSAPVLQNELVSNPASGVLKGRSPPRGIPLSAFLPPRSARHAIPARAPAASRRESVPCDAPPTFVPRSNPFAALLCPRFARQNPFASLITPDRASEGGPAGSSLPSWRHVS
jgi:hypothetical protein